MSEIVRYGAKGRQPIELESIRQGPVIADEGLIHLLHQLECWYTQLRDANGNWLGPLVAYRGEYLVDEDNPEGEKKRWVGRAYVNCRPLNKHGEYRLAVARGIFLQLLERQIFFDGVVGNPTSGIPLGQTLADLCGAQSVYLEEKTGKLTLGDTIDVPSGEEPWVVLGEELLNNGESSRKAIKALRAAGVRVVAIASYFNRSGSEVLIYEDEDYCQEIPIIAGCWRPMPEFRQDDPEVAGDIAVDNIVWSPKTPPENWARLKAAMAQAAKEGGQ